MSSTYIPDNKKFVGSWTGDAPTINVIRASKYGELRRAVELLAAGNAPEPFFVVTTRSSKDAARVAQSLSTYRRKRSLENEIAYAQRGNTITIWNAKHPPKFSADMV